MLPLVLAGLATAALAAWALRRAFAGYPAAPAGLRCLSRREHAIVSASALATFPPGGAITPSGIEAGVPGHVDRFVAALPPRARLLIRLLFALVEHATLVFPPRGRGRFRRFTRLSPEQQVEYLGGWRGSGVFSRRLVFSSLRAILTMGYFADPAVLRELGLAPRAIEPPRCEADLLWPRIGEHPSTLNLTAADVAPARPLAPLGARGELHPDYAPHDEEAAR